MTVESMQQLLSELPASRKSQSLRGNEKASNADPDTLIAGR